MIILLYFPDQERRSAKRILGFWVYLNSGVFILRYLGLAGSLVAMENRGLGIRVIFSMADQKCDPTSNEGFSKYHHKYFMYSFVVGTDNNADVIITTYTGWNLHHRNSYDHHLYDSCANNCFSTKGTKNIKVHLFNDLLLHVYPYFFLRFCLRSMILSAWRPNLFC